MKTININGRNFLVTEQWTNESGDFLEGTFLNPEKQMNTYKIKANNGLHSNKVTLVFTVDTETLRMAKEAGQLKLKNDGYPYGRVETITELGPSKAPSPAKTDMDLYHEVMTKPKDPTRKRFELEGIQRPTGCGYGPGCGLCIAPRPVRDNY